MRSTLKSLAAVWVGGLVLFFLHLAENRLGFDTATGLSVPTSARTLLVAGVILAAVLILFSCRKESAARPLFADHFAVPEKAKLPLILGALLWIAGGGLLAAVAFLTRAGIAPMVTGGLAFISGCGLILLTKRMRDEEADSVTPLLPAMFFGAFWVLSLYLPGANDPVFARYWLNVLAAAVDALAISFLAGFFRGETKVRTFAVTARLGVLLSLAAAADLDPTSAPLYLGCAVVLSAFAALAGSEAPVDNESETEN